MNVLVLGRSLPDRKDSYGLFEFEQALSLANAGMNTVFVFADNRSVRYNRAIKHQAGQLHGLPYFGETIPAGGLPSSLFNRIKTKSLLSLLDRLSQTHLAPEIVYAHFPSITLTEDVVQVLKDRKIPLVCMEHWSKVQTKEINSYRIGILRKCVQDSFAFCCVSNDLKQSVCDLVGVGSEKIRIVPNMVDAAVFHPQNLTEHAAKKKSYAFFSYGRLIDTKRFDYLIDSFSRIPKTLSLHLTIAGDGPLRKTLQSQIRKQGMEDGITLVGWKAPGEIARLLNESDCFVTASGIETFCVPIAEAWMCGKPCIAPSSNPLRDYFDAESGLLFEADDNPLALTEALLKAVQQGPLSSSSTASLAKRSYQIFSQEAVVNEISRLFSSAIHISQPCY